MPVTRKAKPKAEDDDYEDEEEEEYFPKSRGARKATKATAAKPSRRAKDDDDDEEDDEDESDLPGIKSGWGAYKRNREEASNFPGDLKLDEEPALVMFMEDEPLASYNQHWIERKGKRSFMCIAPEQECPLCAIGDPIRTQNVFNVLVFSPGGDPANNVLRAGVKLTDILQSKSRRKGLTSGYWAIARTGKGGNTNYDVSAVKERDLEEDWDVDPLDGETLEKLTKKKWTAESAVSRQTRKELTDIAKEVVGDYDDDDEDD